MSETKPHYHGHRQRLRERFLQVGVNGLAEYELLELLLMQAIPRKDVKPLAKDLLAQFGTLAALIEAPHTELSKINGLSENSAATLKLAHSLALNYRKTKLEKHNIKDRLSLLEYLYAKMSGLKHEEVHGIYLDSKNNLVAEEKLFTGTVNASAVYPREVLKKALEVGAISFVLVHNHPSGDPSPSTEDIHLTHRLNEAAMQLDIKLHDHIIIGNDRHYSFRDHGAL